MKIIRELVQTDMKSQHFSCEFCDPHAQKMMVLSLLKWTMPFTCFLIFNLN
jgi:hypothetical protein